jgi:elongation factor Ts
MTIAAADVKKLRDQTGAGMMDAKKALTEADGDFEKATEILRVSGAVKAAKRSDREASNGLVAGSGKALIQLGAETDFVAKNEEFMSLAAEIAEAVALDGADSVDKALAVTLAGGTVEETISALSIKIGEKLELTNVANYTGDTHTYLHRRSQDLPPQVGVLVEYTGAKDEALVHNVALQIASMSPIVVTKDDVPAETVESEKRIAEATAKEEGKPDQAIPRIIEGRVQAFYKDNCLVEQAAIFGETATVGEALDQGGVTITRFVRFSAGA